MGQLFSSDKSFKATHGILKCTKALSSKPKLIIRFWRCVYFETALYSEVVSFLFILHSKASLRVKVYKIYFRSKLRTVFPDVATSIYGRRGPE